MQIYEILNLGFILCLAFAILFFVITVVLFFVFDIRTIFNIRTGRAQAKTVKEMENANTSTGRLRVGKQTQTDKLSKNSSPVRTAPVVPPSYEEPKENITEQLSTEGAEETGVLGASGGYGANETQPKITEEIYAETSVLGVGSAQNMTNTSSENIAGIYFEIIKKVICRDTDEVVR